MCGIAGFCNRQKTWREDIERMKEQLISRGPDAEGSWCNDSQDVTLGHRRLSILDLSPGGAQPMVSHSGRFVISYNGEIYNCREVEKKLRREGLLGALHGSSDTEILLEALEAYGVKEGICLCKGMFAIALYDRKEEQLWLLRDRVGEKPLYYGLVNGSFVFASELTAIAALPDFCGKINKDVLDLYLIHGYIPAPYSIYEGIYKLEPGKILRLEKPYRDWRIETYWSMAETAKKGQEQPFTGSRQEASEELERLLTESIRGQMMADVPLGAFLSAGIDSSTVVSLMQSISDRKVKTFTIGMEDAAYNEAEAAAAIAAHLGTEHTQLTITEQEPAPSAQLKLEQNDRGFIYVRQWVSSSPSVAQVSSSGTVTGQSSGRAVISALTTAGQVLRCTVTVTSEIGRVQISKNAMLLQAVGASQKLTAQAAGGKNTAMTWLSSNPDVAQVSTDGTVTAVGDGETVILAVSPEGRANACYVAVGTAAWRYRSEEELAEVLTVSGQLPYSDGK